MAGSLVTTTGMRLSLVPGCGWSCSSCIFSMGLDLEKRKEQRTKQQVDGWVSAPQAPRPTLQWRVKVARRPQGAAQWLAPGGLRSLAQPKKETARQQGSYGRLDVGY